MSIGVNNEQGLRVANRMPYCKRMIRCPGHYLVPPTVDVYLREPVPELRYASNVVEYQGKRLRIKKERIVRDIFGRKKINWKKLYELRKKGTVLQPWVSAAWAIEHVYDPLSEGCLYCDKRCKEGQGKVIVSSIKRLMGIPIKSKRSF